MKTKSLSGSLIKIVLMGLLVPGFAIGQYWDDDGNDIYNTNSGNVGIGTTSPDEKLEVTAGNIKLDWLNSKFIFGDGNSGQTQRRVWAIKGTTYGSNSILDFLVSTTPGGSPTTSIISFRNDGNVGIGTTSPQSKLSVNGTITAKEVEVTSTGWPDHVFADTYRLRPLAEVETYIKANRHLPDVPSAAEVEEEGVALGKMQATLLQKVEELTLYVIDLNKENEALKKRVASLEREQ
ncbi:MAG: hypothetical protein JSU77_06180 [Fidelibacterota bacterium]|nr:MAG: hypothetical protein JSU77_06180 [Candidatus Neomarinimicrobiota bacterium]